jgi:hypothetical protein
MRTREAIWLLRPYEALVVPRNIRTMPSPALAVALQTLAAPDALDGFVGVHIGTFLQWCRFPQTPEPDLFERLFRHSDKYPTAAAFVTAIKSGQCLEVGAWIRDGGTGVTGRIVREGTITNKEWPAWTIDRGGTIAGCHIEVFPKDSDSLTDVTGCTDQVLESVWNFAQAWRTHEVRHPAQRRPQNQPPKRRPPKTL